MKKNRVVSVVCLPDGLASNCVVNESRRCHSCGTLLTLSLATKADAEEMLEDGGELRCVCVACAGPMVPSDLVVKVGRHTANAIANVFKQRNN